MKFSSPQFEAVFALPVEDARVSVIVSNTTPQPLPIKGEAVFARHNTPYPIPGLLKPYETQVVSLPVGQIKGVLSGAVSLSHNGEKGALMANAEPKATPTTATQKSRTLRGEMKIGANKIG